MNFYEQIFNRGRATGEGMTHFERLFAAKFGGSPPPEVREYTGAVPVTITADGTPLLDYLITGNTVQNGTPTPDNPIMPQGTGDRTGNLFDKSSDVVRHYISSGSGAWAQTGSTSRSILIKCEPNTTYTIFVPTNRTLRAVYFYNYPSEGDIGYGYTDNTTGDYVNKTLTITTNSSAQYLAFFCYNSAQEATMYDEAKYFSQIMLNTGSTPLPYEPYGYKIPISSAGQTTPVYLGEVESTRRIKKLVLTGQETVIQSVVTNCVQIDVADTILRTTIYSSHFQYVITVPGETARNGKVFHASGAGAGSICFGTSSTPSNFKQWLSAQYSAGTPVTVWYILATPATGIVNEPLMRIGDYADTLSYAQAGVTIPTNNGSTTVDVDTDVKPSEVYIKYMG